MSDQLVPAEERLIGCLAETGAGPRQNGTYALWLFVRVCDGFLPPDTLSDEGQKARLGALERKLRKLSLPPPLRRALAGALREVADGTAHAVATALQRLVAPARESVGPDAAEAVALAARAARDVSREIRGTA